ncbi:hypothetical protein [Novosphingobium album (ex Hu et al. 2023)]|uniref:Transporter n=1 Tax=Novosphingobium album (ex Hu et al. 2023) TaxID=2930093 RepID=A0ABT0B4R2_9SPHN|nr:hypothetical protein [Novosphingobium album (ex Hu et al. 2023)]MCJ2179881.1 hypothetical protein [Novosphingobium album (ex Hu et al. 2023)]
MRRHLFAFSLVLQGVPYVAHAAETKAVQGNAVLLMPATLEWSMSDRTAVDRAKSRDLVTDNDDAGLGVEFLSLRSNLATSAALGPDRMKMHVRELRIGGWHDLGMDAVLRIHALAGVTSRFDRDSPVSTRKTRSSNMAVEAAVEYAGGWQLRGGWFAQGGWGGHSLAGDAARMANGEPAAARGMRLALQMPSLSGGPAVSIEAVTGTKGVSGGMPLAHRGEIALKLAAAF